MIESQPAPPNTQPKSSQNLFLLLGLLWLILGGVIVWQLPSAVPNVIRVNWETETETDTAGFNVYRAVAVDDGCDDVDPNEYVQVNDQLINSSGNAIQGDSYNFTDRNIARQTTYCYQLEDIELSGRTERHEPIIGNAPRQLDRILYIVLAPLSFIVGLSLIYSGLKREKKL